MIVSPRVFVASLLMLSSAASIAAAETSIADCSGIASAAGSTSECCSCICGHDNCAIFQRFGEELACLPDRVHCYDPLGTDEDDSPLKQNQEEGEWVLQDASVDTTTIVANPKAKVISPHLLQCRQTPIMPGKTDECCQCACSSSSSCAVFKSFGEELVCDPLKIHCYDDDDDDKETFEDAEGEWVETIKEGDQADKFAMCLDIEIPSASQTEDCCRCACGTSECAIFKTAGKDLECNAANIHCYEPDEDDDDDDDDGSCLDVAIPDDASTDDCCECLCGHSFCSVFKEPGKPLTCEASKVHCFDDNDDSNDTKKQEAAAIATSDGAEGSTSPMLADCSAVDVSLDETRSCCTCACGHHDCAIYHSIGSKLTCDKLKIHCYSQEGEDDDDASGAFLGEKESSGASHMTGMAALTAAAVALFSFMA